MAASTKSLLLIGPSQVGKSQLGTFLLHGIVDPAKKGFEIGNGQLSCTKVPLAKETEYLHTTVTGNPEEIEGAMNSMPLPDGASIRSEAEGKGMLGKLQDYFMKEPRFKHLLETKAYRIRVIDTPGVGDNLDREEMNMLSLYQLLANSSEINAAVLVVKFASFLTEEWKANLRFYKQLLPELFVNNAMLVVTHYDESPAGIQKFKRSGTDPFKALLGLREQVKLALQLDYDLPTYQLDSLAWPEEPAFELATSARRAIFERSLAVDGVRLAKQAFPKPISWRRDDQRIILQKQAHRDGITLGLQIAQSSLAEVSSNAVKQQEKIEATKSDLKKAVEDLKDKDSIDPHPIRTEQFKGEWKFFGRWWARAKFDIATNVTICMVSWSGGAPKYTRKDDHQISGTVYSNFWGDLDATVTVYQKKKEFFSKEIFDLNVKTAKLDAQLCTEQDFYSKLLSQDSRLKQELGRLEAQLTVINCEIVDLSKDYITLGQLQHRVELGGSGSSH